MEFELPVRISNLDQCAPSLYPGEICLENASCYRMIALYTQRSIGVLLTILLPCTTGGTPRACTRAKVVISCSNFSNADQGYMTSN